MHVVAIRQAILITTDTSGRHTKRQEVRRRGRSPIQIVVSFLCLYAGQYLDITYQSPLSIPDLIHIQRLAKVFSFHPKILPCCEDDKTLLKKFISRRKKFSPPLSTTDRWQTLITSSSFCIAGYNMHIYVTEHAIVWYLYYYTTVQKVTQLKQFWLVLKGLDRCCGLFYRLNISNGLLT